MTNSNTQSLPVWMTDPYWCTILPEYTEWVASPQSREHLLEHLGMEIPGCAGCVTRSMLKDIHTAVMVEGKFISETWALQDGYGEPGFTPAQGWDWSGIRDSSPAAISRMYRVVNGTEVIEVAS